MDICYIKAIFQLYLAGVGHFLMVSNGELVHKAVSQLYMTGLGHLVMVNNGQLLYECSISVVHGWSGPSCNDK